MKQTTLSAPATDSGRPTAPRVRLPAVDINRLGAGLAIGAVAGAVICGAGARIAMRVVALLGENQPGFTVGGTLAIVIMGAVLGALGGLGFALVLVFVLGYCGLTTLVFWRGSQDGMAKLAALTLLLFAAAFFGRQPALANSMQALPLVRLLPGLLQAAGLSLLLILMFILPDRRFALPWTRPIAVIWCGWSLLWFTNPLPATPLDVSAWPEPLLMAVLTVGLGSGLAALGWRARQGSAQQRRQICAVFVGFAVALLSFLLLWLASLGAPDLRLRVLPLPQALLAFGLYLLPWLALPLLLVVATQRGLYDSSKGKTKLCPPQ